MGCVFIQEECVHVLFKENFQDFGSWRTAQTEKVDSQIIIAQNSELSSVKRLEY